MNYNIVQFDKTMLHLLPRRQQPFDIIGKLIPTYNGVKWNIEEELHNKRTEKTYPDDSFNPIEYIDNPDQAAFLAMLDDECVGSIRVCKRWNGNAFIDDLAIDRLHRGQGLGRKLMDAAVQWGKERGLYGVSLETQDNNLLACRFYLKYGFRLGGIDTKVYTHPLYKGETALYFYLLLEN
jgi:ribosomal protein S18 acetylase RimI-like enzyme